LSWLLGCYGKTCTRAGLVSFVGGDKDISKARFGPDERCREGLFEDRGGGMT